MLRNSLLFISALLLCSCTQPQERSVSVAMPSPAPSVAAATQIVLSTPLPSLTAIPTPSASPIPTPSAMPSPTSMASPTPSATPSPTAMPSPTHEPGIDPEIAAREQHMLEIINQIRVQAGVAPYQRDSRLDQVARAHSCDMAINHFIGHGSSDGRKLQDRISTVEPAWTFPSESVAAGSADPQVIVDMWMDEPPDGWHRRNILDADKNPIGIGYCYTAEDPTNNHHYWTMDIVSGAS